MAAFYFLLCDKDPSKEPNNSKTQVKSEKPSSKQTPRKAKISEAAINATPEKSNSPADNGGVVFYTPTPSIPAININLQIHISSDASPEQIDKIFESMSKHIYSRES